MIETLWRVRERRSIACTLILATALTPENYSWATIAETRKLVDQYKKQLQTAMTKVRDQEADVKDLLKKQEQKPEKDAKAEKKDANKKAGLEKAAQELGEEREKAATTFLGELKESGRGSNEATVKEI